MNTIKKATPISNKIDTNDLKVLRHGRETHTGFDIGQTISPPPMLFSRDGHNIWISDIYKGCSAFLVLGGPSFGLLIKDKTKIQVNDKESLLKKDCLKYPGVLTMSVNNTPKTFRTDLWTCVDDPTHFIKSIWLDPKIQKFIPLDHAEKFIFDNEKWVMTDIKTGDCPNVIFYRRNEHFQPNQFLTENTFNWGNHKDYGGGRSVMLVAIRMLYYLGVRKIYLLGCDFVMSDKQKYHFAQNRTKSSQKGNNETYSKLINRFIELKPIFEQYKLEIFNCNFDSELRVFPFIDFKDAFLESIKQMPLSINKERTQGLYERASEIKKNEKRG